MSEFLFQYCQKLVVFSADMAEVFLARRQNEADYDRAWAFIGGKLETKDKSIIAGLKREKYEEVGPNFRLKVYPLATHNLLFTKSDGTKMVLPHYLAVYLGGEVKLNRQEYSDYKWVSLADLKALEPKIETIPAEVDWAEKLSRQVSGQDFVEI